MAQQRIPDLQQKAVPVITDLLEISQNPGSFYITIDSLANIYQRITEKGQPNGYAELDADGLVPEDQIPTGGGIPVPDNLPIVVNSIDDTKELVINVAAITTATTRTLSMIDGNVVVVGETNTQTITNKTLGTGTVFSTIPTINDGITFTFNPNANVAGINVGSGTADPLVPVNGDLFYNTTTNRLRAYQNGSWTDVVSGSQTPWLSDIDADGFDLTDLSNLLFNQTTGTPAFTENAIWKSATALNINVPTANFINLDVNGVIQLRVSDTQINVLDNDIIDIGNLIPSAFVTNDIGVSTNPFDQIYARQYVPVESNMVDSRHSFGRQFNRMYVNYEETGISETGFGIYEEGDLQFLFSKPPGSTRLEFAIGDVPFVAGEEYRIQIGQNPLSSARIDFVEGNNDLLIDRLGTGTTFGVKLQSDSNDLLYARAADILLSVPLNMDSNNVINIGRALMVNRFQYDKGADIISPAGGIVTLGDDGNVFDITGTNTINEILATNWQAGSMIHLQFDGILTVTNNSGGINDILLGNGANFTSAAGDVLSLYFDGTDWKEVARSTVGGAGGAQTPWTSDIDADGFDLTDLSNVEFRTTTGAPAGTVPAIYFDTALTPDALVLNVPSTNEVIISINGVEEYAFGGSVLSGNGNVLQNFSSLQLEAAANTILRIENNTSNPINGTIIGTQEWVGDTVGGGNVDYVQFISTMVDTTVASADGEFAIWVTQAGTLSEYITLNEVGAQDITFKKPLDMLNNDISMGNGEINVNGGVLGDLLKHSATGFVRFPIGTANQHLVVNPGGTDLIWAAGGDVTGPASSVNHNLAVFDGTTGKIIDGAGSAGFEIIVDVAGQPTFPRAILFTTTTVQPSAGAEWIESYFADLLLNVSTGNSINLTIQGANEYLFNATGLSMFNNNILNSGVINFDTVGATALAATEPQIYFDTTLTPDAMVFNVPDSNEFVFEMNGAEEFSFSPLQSDWNSNHMINLGRTLMVDRFQYDKGADVASPAGGTLTLGDDGNVFDITGTNTIDEIVPTNWQAGSMVHLQFDGILTVTHNAGAGNEIILGNNANFITAPGDILTLYFDGVLWREVSRNTVGGAQTPWVSDIDANGFDLTDLSNIEFRNSSGIVAAATPGIYYTTVPIPNALIINVPDTEDIHLHFNDVLEYTFTQTESDWEANDMINIGNITVNDDRQLTVNSGINTAGYRDLGHSTDPLTPLAGELYYNNVADEFRFYNGTAWLAFAAQTPWTQDIDADGFDLTDLSNIEFRNSTGIVANATPGIYYTTVPDPNHLVINVPTGEEFHVTVNGIAEYHFNATELEMEGNDITNSGSITLNDDEQVTVNSGINTAGFRDIGHTTDPLTPLAGELYYNTTVNRFHYYNGTAWVAAGDVAGPASATDQAVALFDGTTGNLIKNSDLIYDFTTTKQLTLPGPIILSAAGTVPAGTETYLREDAGNLDINVNAANNIILQFGGTPQYQFDNVRADFTGNNIINAIITVASTLNGTVVATAALSYANGLKQVFNPSTANAGINVGAEASDPSAPVNGDIFYNSVSNRFRFYQNSAWVTVGDVIGPATSTDNGIARYDGATGNIIQDSGVLIDDNDTLTVPGPVILNADGTAPAATETYLRELTGNLIANVATANTVNLAVNGVTEYTFDATDFDMNSNNIVDPNAIEFLVGAATLPAFTTRFISTTATSMRYNVQSSSNHGFLINGVLEMTINAGSVNLSGNPLRNTPVIQDSNSNELLNFVENASAVNYVQIENRVTGLSPIISVEGADTNLDLRLVAKGTGSIRMVDKLNLNITSLVTISGNVITVTRSYHEVATEGGAATDDLNTINGGNEGDLLILSADNSSDTVVLNDGTGNLRLSGSFSLTHIHDTITLIYNGAVWTEVSRSNNAA